MPQVAGRAAAPLGFWELLTYIVDEPAPVLPDAAFSRELRDFVAACLQAREPLPWQLDCGSSTSLCSLRAEHHVILFCRPLSMCTRCVAVVWSCLLPSWVAVLIWTVDCACEGRHSGSSADSMFHHKPLHELR